jgi:outer membrane protein OmpA-like peptidoglycan-associated protein
MLESFKLSKVGLHMQYLKYTLITIVTISLLTSCAGTTHNGGAGQNTQQGAIIGAIAGAVIAGATSRKSDRKRKILQGALLGGVAGGTIGYSLDRQAAQMAQTLETNVDNSPDALKNPNSDIIVSKRDNYVQITFREAMMFATNSSTPTPSAASKVARVGSVLKNYPQTIVQVVGHTDNRGSYNYNMDLSNKRAYSVSDSVKYSGIPNQVFAKGCSYSRPIVPNSNQTNMALNRRVEIYLYPNQQFISDPCR